MRRLTRPHAISCNRLTAPLLALGRLGVTPEKPALSMSLGTAIGPIPILGVSTAPCAVMAVILSLSMSAIQLVNYLLTPLQIILSIPQLRPGELLLNAPRFPIALESALAWLLDGTITAMQVLAAAIVHATLAWIVLAPVVALVPYHLLEPRAAPPEAPPGGTAFATSPRPTRELLNAYFRFEKRRKAVESPSWLYAENTGG